MEITERERIQAYTQYAETSMMSHMDQQVFFLASDDDKSQVIWQGSQDIWEVEQGHKQKREGKHTGS